MHSQTTVQAKIVPMNAPKRAVHRSIISLEMINTIPADLMVTEQERLYLELFLVWATNQDKDMDAIIVRWDNVLMEHSINVDDLDYWDEPLDGSLADYLSIDDEEIVELLDEEGYTGFVDEINTWHSGKYTDFRLQCAMFFEDINEVQL